MSNRAGSQGKAPPGVFPTPALSPLSPPAPANTGLTPTLICLWMMSLVMLAFAIFLQWGRQREAVGRAAVHPSIPAKPDPHWGCSVTCRTGQQGTRAGTSHIRPLTGRGKLCFPEIVVAKNWEIWNKGSWRHSRKEQWENEYLSDSRPFPVCGRIHDEHNSRIVSAWKIHVSLPAKILWVWSSVLSQASLPSFQDHSCPVSCVPNSTTNKGYTVNKHSTDASGHLFSLIYYIGLSAKHP